MALLIMIIVGAVALWLWVRGNPLGAVGVFLAEVFLFGPPAHPGWSWTNPDDVELIALFAAIALAPIALRAFKRNGGILASLVGPAPTDEPYEPPLEVRMRQPGD